MTTRTDKELEWLGFKPKVFKVWAQIEAGGDPWEDEYENIGEPHVIGSFGTLMEAEDFVARLSGTDLKEST